MLPDGRFVVSLPGNPYAGLVAVHSLSKRSNFAGCRLGFYAGDPEFFSGYAELGYFLTGESRGVWKAPGTRVIGGAINKRSPLVLRVTGVGEQSVLSGIVRLIDSGVDEPVVRGSLQLAVIVAVACALPGVFLVLRRMAMMWKAG